MSKHPSFSFDPSPYVRAPILNIASGLALGQSLLAVAPGPLAAPLKKSRLRLRQIIDSAQQAWASKQRHDTSAPRLSAEEKRSIDQQADRGFGALRMRLEAYALLPEDRPKVKKAERLLRTLFSDGTEFLKWRFAEQFAAMELLLKRITDERLEADLNEVCGAEFLAYIKEVHPRYRDMVHTRTAVAVEADINLAEQVRALADAIADYTIKVCAQVDVDDPETVALVKTLLAPIDEIRQAQNKGDSPSPDAPNPAPAPAPALGPHDPTA